MFKNGTNLNRMENRAVKRNFYYIYQNSNMHKKSGYAKPGKFGLGINVDNYQQK